MGFQWLEGTRWSNLTTAFGNLLVARLYGRDGIDIMNGSDDTYGLYHEQIYGEGDGDFIYAGDGDDYVQGNGGDDVIRGNKGDDIIYGNDGVDELRGNDDNDIVIGGSQADDLRGGNGNDILCDDASDNDTYRGGPQNDELWKDTGGTAPGSCDGGLGTDTFGHSSYPACSRATDTNVKPPECP